jgi:uncharacterized protein (DUF2141 family)
MTTSVKCISMKNSKIRSIFSLFILASVLFLLGCAKQGTPTGGPKDETPPEVVSEIPPNKTIFFNSPKVVIAFNEFITLKDASKEIFVSPPMRTKPEYKVQGKKVIIEFQEELKENATYTINFGNSIVDFTEGNPVVNFEYVFSTGDHLDSLSIPGQVVNAMDLKPETGIIVMVYQDENDTIPLDSLPMMVPPKSASRTTKDGSFRINNLAPGLYKIFALEDLNNNYIFDLPNERIAFLDTLVKLEPPVLPEITADSTAASDTLAVADTTMPGLSIELPEEIGYQLYLFAETDTVQKLLGKKQIGHNLLQYVFKQPLDSIHIKPYEFDPGRDDWFIEEFGALKDTVNFWLKPGLPDTIRVIVSAGDSLVDTSRYILSRGTQEVRVKKKEVSSGNLRIIPGSISGAFDLNKPYTFSFLLPVEDYVPGRIHLFTSTDTLLVPFSFSDTLKRTGVVDYNWMQGEYYEMIVEDSVFRDISGAYNDSTVFKFKVRSQEDYGVLLINILSEKRQGQFIVQLMSDKEVVLKESVISAPEIVKFIDLLPNKYKLKVIHDNNSNGKWDTGNYSEKLLPENVEFYPEELNIRANWDLQEDWQLTK